ncbi:hypothetical protein SAMN04244553_3788 [Nocardia amikacinitolerans]|uniref:Uncharacterized protein n=1 Tax=Nocardia amikacinitolerans TaxID=756689 RepID=A0A285LLL2_9NOCA|nr:hypothetical protein SAMN04244553_3788 [Nocardia amikacinitolerans]
MTTPVVRYPEDGHLTVQSQAAGWLTAIIAFSAAAKAGRADAQLPESERRGYSMCVPTVPPSGRHRKEW